MCFDPSVVFVVFEIDGHEQITHLRQFLGEPHERFDATSRVWTLHGFVSGTSRDMVIQLVDTTDTLTDIDMKTSLALQRLHFCSGR